MNAQQQSNSCQIDELYDAAIEHQQHPHHIISQMLESYIATTIGVTTAQIIEFVRESELHLHTAEHEVAYQRYDV